MSAAPRLLHERQPVRLELPGDAAPDTCAIEATIAEVSEHVLWLECTAATLPAAPLAIGTRVVLRCWDPFGVYCAYTQVIEVGSATRIAVEATSPVEAGENRRFYRVNVEVPFA